MALTERQKRFVEEYLVDLNASAAYQRAGYSAKGNAAESAAARLLRNVQIQEAVQEARKRQQERTEITADWVLKNLKRLSETATSEAAQVRATELIGNHLGMFEERKRDVPADAPTPSERSAAVTVEKFGPTFARMLGATPELPTSNSTGQPLDSRNGQGPAHG